MKITTIDQLKAAAIVRVDKLTQMSNAQRVQTLAEEVAFAGSRDEGFTSMLALAAILTNGIVRILVKNDNDQYPVALASVLSAIAEMNGATVHLVDDRDSGPPEVVN